MHRQETLRALDMLRIPYEFYAHTPVHTIDDCLAIPGIDWQTVEVPRNAFLCNRQQTSFYLMLLRHNIPFRTAVVSKALGVSRLSFAPPALLADVLSLTPGAVSPLGLLFDREKRVTLVVDEALRGCKRLALHPCDNTATVIVSAEDLWQGFLPSLHITPIWVQAMEKEDTP